MKLRKKLIMSAVALAACAATLTSTTYAWYVVNPTADANGMTGATAEADGTASIYVSEDGANFAKSVTITSTDYIMAGTLDPVTTEDGKTFVDIENVESEDYIQFAIWVKTNAKATVTPKFTTVNNTITDKTAFTKQTAYQNVASNAAAGQEFFVDAVQAMRMSIATTTADNKAGIDLTSVTPVIYDLQAIDGADGGYAIATDSVTDETMTMDAHDYYTLLMGSTDAATRDFEAAEAEETWTSFTTEADTPVCLVFTIWLEGADTLCFDSCVNQTFGFNVEFTAANAA